MQPRGGTSQAKGTWKKEVYGSNDVDWDLCTTFARRGHCSRQGCSWRHEGGVWWEGTWWRADGKGWDGKDAPLDDEPAAPAAGRAAWWKSLAVSEECPVSLTPIRELEHEPFELAAGAPSSNGVAKQGPKHRFDAYALANFLVSSGQFMNPVNRRPLEMSECRVLDAHLQKVGLPPLRVADAFLLSGGGAARTAAQREVVSMAHHLFRFASVRERASQEGEVAPANPPGGARQQREALPRRDARTVHADGGLRVVDDNDSEPEGEAGANGPTPAEALAAGSAAAAAPRAPRRAPRPPPAAAGGGVGGLATCNGPATCNGTSGAGRGGGGGGSSGSSAPRPSSSAAAAEEELDSSPAATSSEAWVPEWATPELQRVQLAELDDLLAAHSGSGDGAGGLAADEAGLAALRAAVARGELLLDGAGLRCTFRCFLGNVSLLAAFTLPPLYPNIPLRVSLAFEREGAAPPADADLLARLEAALHEQAISQAPDGKALQAAVEWLHSNAAAEVERLTAELAAARQAAQPARGQRERPPAEPQPEPEGANARKAEKFSPNWDLCTSFVKHGKCKNKNCKWRHERPVAVPAKEEKAASEPQEAPKPKGGAAGKKKKS